MQYAPARLGLPLTWAARLRDVLLVPKARPLRFIGTGVIAGAIQLVILDALTRFGWDALVANLVAFLVAAQVNFALSLTFTWGDRTSSGALWRRWLLFHGSIAVTALLNMLTFAAARTVLPILVASMAGIAVGSIGNYLAGDRLVFRRGSPPPTTGERTRAA